MGEAGAVLDRWGYRSQVRGGEYRLPGVLGQALLINRSPRLDDLTTAAFAALHAHPATAGRQHQATLLTRCSGWSPPWATAIRRCAPATTTRPASRAPSPAWAGWVERWHATSPLTPKVRAIIRTIMAKAGRWLAAEHPEITEPGQWTRADLRGLGRRRRPDGSRRLRPASRRPRTAVSGNRSPRAPRLTSSWPPARSSATARNGNGSPAGSTRPGRWPCRAASPP